MRQRRPQTPATNNSPPGMAETNQIDEPVSARADTRGKTLSPRTLSILNLLAYALNTLETAGVGPFSARFSSGQDNASISQKYQTIITPHGIAFSIWGVIFLSEAIFVGVTLFREKERENVLVVKGVSYWFVCVCLAQTAWSPAFAYELIPLSAFFMGCILLPLLIIVIRQYKTTAKENCKSRSDYWLLQFPFEIHFGWICAAFVLNLNIIVVSLGVSGYIQVIVGVISLMILACVGLACLGFRNPQFTVPWVVVWAMFWMSYELLNPKQSILDTFSPRQIHMFLVLTATTSGVLGMVTLVRWVHCCLLKTNTSEESDGLLRRDGEVS